MYENFPLNHSTRVPQSSLSRRDLLKTVLPVALALSGMPRLGMADDKEKLPPVRVITRGPKHHWFAYYDKLEFDPTGRYCLGMEVDFEHRSPRPDDVIKLGMVDLQDGDRWIELDESRLWCWQQGCMLQWLPGSRSEIIWNDRDGDDFVCRILDVKSGKKRTIGHPIYTLSPDGKTGFAPDFRRIQAMRPGYGYPGPADPCADVLAPKDSGIFRIDLASGKQDLIVSLADVAGIPFRADISDKKHYFNHLLANTDGTRLEFLHRWAPQGKFCRTRMLTCAPDGSDIRVVDGSGCTSHFIWRDANHILAWSWHPRDVGYKHPHGFCLFEDVPGGGEVEIIGGDVMVEDGHCTYLPGKKYVLNDTYPDRNRNQNPYLYELASGRRIPLGHFHQPSQYKGEWRCDTHPRCTPDGRSVVVDAPFENEGRQLHVIDISGIVG